jgi:hypothetical protein
VPEEPAVEFGTPRVPFFLALDGTFLMGQVGDTHWDIPGYEVGSDYWLGKQGQVNFDPETGAEAAMWPVDESTLRTAAWVTAEMQDRVIAEARQRWRAHLVTVGACPPTSKTR